MHKVVVSLVNKFMLDLVFPVLIKFLKEQAKRTETPIDDQVVIWLEDTLEKDFIKILDEVL